MLRHHQLCKQKQFVCAYFHFVENLKRFGQVRHVFPNRQPGNSQLTLSLCLDFQNRSMLISDTKSSPWKNCAMPEDPETVLRTELYTLARTTVSSCLPNPMLFLGCFHRIHYHIVFTRYQWLPEPLFLSLSFLLVPKWATVEYATVWSPHGSVWSNTLTSKLPGT
jgi:hypothetical protein